MKFLDYLSSLYKADIEPFLSSILHSETAVLAPIAAQSLNELAVDEVAAIAAGGKDTGHVLAKAVASTASKMEMAGITASAPSILAAVGNAAQIKAAGQ